MLRIRLRRVGKRKNPSYRIVVADVRAPRDGAYLEWIGNYDPMADPPAVTIKKDRAEEWLSKGAQPSDAVKRILHWQEMLEREPLNQTPQRKKADETPAGSIAPAAPVAAPVAPAVAETPPEASDEEAADASGRDVPGNEGGPEEAADASGEDAPAGDEDPNEVPNE
ncbi:MAG: 30S ribosomal protein S16 [SAR202 cluster bacterium Io17-Chloro-G2]|nr:MAG: 30S ribosomal protein S16 [SAR202 cluster bacterium Io17-Chloro-G2]